MAHDGGVRSIAVQPPGKPPSFEISCQESVYHFPRVGKTLRLRSGRSSGLNVTVQAVVLIQYMPIEFPVILKLYKYMIHVYDPHIRIHVYQINTVLYYTLSRYARLFLLTSVKDQLTWSKCCTRTSDVLEHKMASEPKDYTIFI